MQVFVSKDGQEHGPYNIDQLHDQVWQGAFAEDDFACYDGCNWITIKEVPGLSLKETLQGKDVTSSETHYTARTANNHKYKAFISYSHQDKKWGDWLHKGLETYRVPKGLVGKQTGTGVVPKRLFPIFRDREELPTSAELGLVINQALEDSSHLVVLCSPRSAKSRWVNEEIKEFKRMGKADRILCLIVDGEPNAADKPDLGQEECFPEAAKYEIGEDGELSTQRTDPIAADARDDKDGKRNSQIKVIAGLLGVGFDDLKQRDVARRQKRMAIVSGVSMALVAGMAGLSFWALDQRQEAEHQRMEAERQQVEAIKARDAEAKQRQIAEDQRMETERQRMAAVKAQEAAVKAQEIAVKARDEEVEQRRVAEMELRKATAVSKFVQGIFTAAKPGELQGVDDKDKDLMKLVLRNGADKLDELKDQPEIVAEIRNVLGNTYATLGFYDDAITQLEKSLAIQLLELGSEHPATGNTNNHLGLAYNNKGNHTKAIECFKKALAIKVQSLGTDHLDIASIHDNLGFTYQRQGKGTQALECFEKALAINVNSLGADHPAVANSYKNIGLSYRKKVEHKRVLENPFPHPTHAELETARNDLKKSLEYHQKELAIHLKALGEKHPTVATSYTNVGMAHNYLSKVEATSAQANGTSSNPKFLNLSKQQAKDKAQEHKEKSTENFKKAAAINGKFWASEHPEFRGYSAIIGSGNVRQQTVERYEKTLASNLKSFGPEHPKVADSYIELAEVYRLRGPSNGNKEMIGNYEKALAIYLKRLGPNHSSTRETYEKIDAACFQIAAVSLPDLAIEYYEKSLEIRLRQQKGKIDIGNVYDRLGWEYDKKGDFNKAIEYFEKARSNRFRSGENFYYSRGVRSAKEGSPEKAIAYLEKSLEIQSKSHDPRSTLIPAAYFYLGTANLKKGDFSKAVECYEKSIEIQRKNFGPEDHRLADTFWNIGEAYDEKGDKVMARAYMNKARSIYLLLGSKLRNQGLYDKAIHYHQKVLELALKSFGEEDLEVANSYNNIGATYNQKGDKKNALTYLRKAHEIYLKALGYNHSKTKAVQLLIKQLE